MLSCHTGVMLCCLLGYTSFVAKQALSALWLVYSLITTGKSNRHMPQTPGILELVFYELVMGGYNALQRTLTNRHSCRIMRCPGLVSKSSSKMAQVPSGKIIRCWRHLANGGTNSHHATRRALELWTAAQTQYGVRCCIRCVDPASERQSNGVNWSAFATLPRPTASTASHRSQTGRRTTVSLCISFSLPNILTYLID